MPAPSVPHIARLQLFALYFGLLVALAASYFLWKSGDRAAASLPTILYAASLTIWGAVRRSRR